MSLKKLKTLSLIISILGIFTLIILNLTQQPKEITTNQIQNLTDNNYVKIQGQLKESKIFDNFQILTINDKEGKFTTILFSEQQFQKNSSLTIIGTIQTYKDQKQIQAEKIIENVS